ncbi:MAG: hypothetical protein UZ17_ACD001002398 [Acidobacteria bacterium OLB17]|nr:MAG: hypothetical protein UZ17_ACD001002398 [Acidobacteria bacterium OLB17]MCZ2392111.1 hypothetical protein [Acidobacteriota bacterium]
MAIIVGIDGTGGGTIPGRARDARYDVAFQNSFVRRITRSGGPNSAYFRGPVTLGGGLMDAIDGAVRFIGERRKQGVQEPVLLTGYSRGAAGAVVVAKRLSRKNVEVQAMLLFDCVDRHLFIDAEVIPANVKDVLHIRRHPAAKSRESFGNDGTLVNRGTRYQEQFFVCTHGGVGGTPWIPERGQKGTDLIDEGFPDGMTAVSFDQDARVSGQVWETVRPYLILNGFV